MGVASKRPLWVAFCLGPALSFMGDPASADGRNYVGSDDCWTTKFCLLPPCGLAMEGVVCFPGGHVGQDALGQSDLSISDALGKAGPVAGFACQADGDELTCGGSGALAEPFCASTTVGDDDGWDPDADLYVFIGGSAGSFLECGVVHPGTRGTVQHSP